MSVTYYPVNDLNISSYTIQNVSSSDGKVFVNPKMNTANPSIYKSLILNGYTGPYSDQIMTIAKEFYNQLRHAAYVATNTIVNKLPGINQTTSGFVIGGVEILMVY